MDSWWEGVCCCAVGAVCGRHLVRMSRDEQVQRGTECGGHLCSRAKPPHFGIHDCATRSGSTMEYARRRASAWRRVDVPSALKARDSPSATTATVTLGCRRSHRQLRVSAALGPRAPIPRHRTHATRVRHLWRLHWGRSWSDVATWFSVPDGPGCFVGKRVWFIRTWEPQVWDRHQDYCRTLQLQHPSGNSNIVCSGE